MSPVSRFWSAGVVADSKRKTPVSVAYRLRGLGTRCRLVVGSLFLLASPPALAEVQLGLATDVTPWFLHGYSAIATLESDALPDWRLSAEVWGMRLPSLLIDAVPANSGAGWQRQIDFAVGLYADRHLGERGRWHLGGVVNTMSSTITRADSAGSTQLLTLELLARGGFRWFPSSKLGLFIDPWLGLGPLFPLREPEAIGGDTYTEARAQLLGTVHLGWRW